MLRLLVLLLLAANAGYFAWAQGGLQRLGLAPATQREPQRLEQQLRPEALRLAASGDAPGTPPAVATAPAAPPARACLQSALLDMAQAAALRERAAAVLPEGRWAMEPATEPARWIVYMGRYTDGDQVERKRAELRALGVSPEPLANAALEPGLSLGAHPSREAATAAMAELARRGVHTARVVEERPEQQGQVLRIASPRDAAGALALQLAPALGGTPLRACD